MAKQITKKDKPYELRNIKTNPSGYQIQFIVNGKSHSDFSTDLEKAKKIRDKMERKLNVAPNGVFRNNYKAKKSSNIPGTNKPMAAGITLNTYQHQGSKSYSIIVNWRDYTGKKRVKTFYGCSETRYTRKVMKAAYDRGLSFRKAYEEAIIEGSLNRFDPAVFNKNKSYD